MRFLTCNDHGLFILTDYPAGSTIPPYAIFSHTWGTEEVTYEDITKGSGLHKSGYDKIRFCGEQAKRDGLQYFWVDTCCIDKSSSQELTEAINSMFQWYSNATKCYAFLADVVTSGPAHLDGDRRSNQAWDLSFPRSRWFTRGWTLQELLAPAKVDFFSAEGVKLGDKKSLERLICGVTGIPPKVLRGSPLSLSHCTVSERMAWAERRKTTRPEDKAYSLLGIFNVHIPLIYGEGEENALKRLREKIDEALKEFSVPFSLNNIPEIENFVAREQELAEMHTILSSDGSRRVVVLHGLGGIGKTQLAIAYAKQHKDNYSAIFWLNIKDENSLKQSFVKIARQIKRQHPLANRVGSVDIEGNLDGIIDAVMAWLSLPNNTRWLLVYDNYDNPKLPNADSTAVDILQYFPEAYQGSVVITTRSSQVKIGHAIRMVKIRNIYDSLKILSTTSKREGLTDDPDAVVLAKELDGLPLALAVAGAYLEQTSTTFGSYLRLYKDSWAQLQVTSPELRSYEDRTLYSTWQLSLDQIQQRNKHSAAFLQLWAYFDNQDIWLELLQHQDLHDLGWVHEVTKDELSFNHMIRTLADYGLVEVNHSAQELIESRGYSVHSCVHSWMIHVLNQEWSEDLARFAIKCVASHIPKQQSIKWWLTQRRLLQHAAKYSCDTLDKILDDDTAWVFHSLGNLYRHQGNLKEAEKMYQQALQRKEKALGPNHTSTLDTVHHLGVLFVDQDKLKEAEEMYQQALQGKEKTLGPDHPLTLDTVHNLGNLYKDQGKLKEAEAMYQWALQGSEKALGLDHTSTLSTVNSLGTLYKDQGKLKEAEEMYQRALRGNEKTLGPDHPLTLTTVDNLGSLYKDQGKLKEAEEMLQRALQGSEKTLGPDHSSTLDTVHNLGNLYCIQAYTRIKAS
ncbi:kinesin light chain [Xylariaceae sp. AK1471]|nr:kinesin light chain [Xylariaceae sp. AK1471]